MHYLAALCVASTALAAAAPRQFTVTNFLARHVPNMQRVNLDFDIAFPGSNSTDGSHCHSVTRNIPGNGLVPKRSPIIGFTCDDEGIYSSSLRSNEDPAKHPNAAYELAINYDDYYSTPYSATFSIGDLFLHKGMVDTVEVPAGSGKKWQVIDQAGPLVFGQQTVPYP